MDTNREKIYLAALLHDIGKFYQRADAGSVKNSMFLKDYCKEESTFCPLHEGFYSHKHVLWTAQFIDDYSAVFKNLTDSEIDNRSNKDNLLNLAACHHLGKEQLSDLGKIIKEADCLSSGMDRDNAFNDVQDEQDWDAFKKKRMTSILQTIGRDSALKETWKHLPVVSMALSKDYFPKDSFSDSPDYLSLWESFKGEFKFIQANTYRAFAETLLNLLQKYTSCVPSSTIDFPDVSLYDHLKTTAAISVCLYDFYQAKEANDKQFLLIGADFSGIQSYIYQIVSKYAGKNLKGRSFYLSILSDTIVRYLVKELNLFQANIVYNSGGSFYLLAPNTEFVRTQLEKAIQTIEEHLFATHGTSLFVAIDSVELSKDALMHKNGQHLGKIWGDLFVKRDRKQSAKFATQISTRYSDFFEPILQGGDAKRDSITGEEFLPNEMVIADEGLTLKRATSDQIKLGKKLREANLVVIKEGEPLPYWKDKTHITPANLGFTYYFLSSENDLIAMKDELRASADKVTVVTLNGVNGDCNFMQTMNGVNNIYALSFYGGNEIDRKNVPTFEEMCENNNFSRMGVLRMDVDNLGSIFQKGIAPERATLSRYAALSRSFDFFFSGYLNTIWRETDPNRSFIIYSGGDDVFVVGSWDVMIELAKRIRNDFREFTCGNPTFTLSGGVAIVPAKYPIMKGADESETEEKQAKNHTCKSHAKNALSFMDTPLNWDNEFPIVENLKDSLCGWLKKEQLPKSFISKLMMHYENADVKDHRIGKAKTYWMLTYDLSRLKSRSNEESVNLMIDNCIKEVCDKNKGTLNGEPIQTDYHPLELWAFAARWAELEYRTEKQLN